MTQEQKVRTRDEQEAVLYLTMKSLEGGIPLSHDPDHLMKLASKHILEAEARGAAEERGKGAESDRPAAYCWTYRIGGKWRFSEKFPTATSPTRKPKFISPLYTRPANVAALEARVAELEEAATDAIALIREGRPVLARTALCRVTTDRAALKRGGRV